MHDQHTRLRREHRDQREVLAGVIRHFRKQQGVDGKRAAETDADGITIGIRLSDRVSTGIGAGARAILDHERLAEFLLHMFADQPPDHVRCRAGAERHDDPDGFCGPLLRHRERSEQECAQRQRDASFH